VSTTAQETVISLEVACDHPECATFAFPLERQLSLGPYYLCSVMELPGDIFQWRYAHRTARKRADRCHRRGYRFVDVNRHDREEEIFLINISAAIRQGRPMSASYMERSIYPADEHYPCPRHGIHSYGIEEPDGTLVAYTFIYRAGQLALVSQILGHHDYLRDEIMFLLWERMLQRELHEPGFVVYNRHDSGTDGLRFFKERVGLAETPVRWRP